jgi:RNA polymerase sigma-70 factor (ECF subfamily)
MGSGIPADESFESAVRANLGALVRVATRLTGRPADADDLVQETLIRALRSYAGLRPGSHVRSWLLRILNNTYISAWRRRKREQALLQPGVWQVRAPWIGAPSPARPADEATVAQLSDEVSAALAALPDDFRRCIELVDLEDRTYREASEIIGRPIGTVMSRLHRGRRLLRDSLAGVEPSERLAAA